MSRVSDLQVPAGVRSDLYQAAEDAYPLEACGVLLGTDDLVTEIRPLPNRSPDPGSSYEIGPADLEPLLRAASGGGSSVVGFYHSHPDASSEPSRRDREQAWPGYWYMIVGVSRGAATTHDTWRLSHA